MRVDQKGDLTILFEKFHIKEPIMTLWDKGISVDKAISAFTVGDDYILDLKLLEYDCKASTAHAKALEKAGILTAEECTLLVTELAKIAKAAKKGEFLIEAAQEDGHTAIEDHLTKVLGDLGKKIHTGRSRNDQVLAALRLYVKEYGTEIVSSIAELISSVTHLKNTYKDIPLPGYTHTRKAMPASVGMWAEAFAAAFDDDQHHFSFVLDMMFQSPLGTGAGYGVPLLNLDRQMVADALSFRKVQETMYVQNSRGKFEAAILDSLSLLMLDLNKMATDLIFYTLPQMGYMTLPMEFCTGSSIMPQKKNPDVLELVRARCHEVIALATQIKNTTVNMISGYHRDLQLTKGALLKGMDITHSCVDIMTLVVKGVTVNADACTCAMTDELYATEEAYKLVKEGMPFRDAYREIGKKFSK